MPVSLHYRELQRVQPFVRTDNCTTSRSIPHHLCSKWPRTRPCRKPGESSSNHYTISMRSVLILYSHPCLSTRRHSCLYCTLYLGSPYFESWPECILSWLRFLLIFLKPCPSSAWIVPQTGLWLLTSTSSLNSLFTDSVPF